MASRRNRRASNPGPAYPGDAERYDERDQRRRLRQCVAACARASLADGPLLFRAAVVVNARSTPAETRLYAIIGPAGTNCLTSFRLRGRAGFWIELDVDPASDVAQRGRLEAVRNICIQRLTRLIDVRGRRVRGRSQMFPETVATYGTAPDTPTSAACEDLARLLRDLARFNPQHFAPLARLRRVGDLRQTFITCTERPCPSFTQSDIIKDALCPADGPRLLDEDDLCTSGPARATRTLPVEAVPSCTDAAALWGCGIFGTPGHCARLARFRGGGQVVFAERMGKCAVRTPISFTIPHVSSAQDSARRALGRVTIEHGLAYARGTIAPGPDTVGDMANSPQEWFAPVLQVHILGITCGLPVEDAGEEIQTEAAVLLQRTLTTHIAARRCTGRPTPLGFSALFETRNHSGPSIFRGVVAATPGYTDPPREERPSPVDIYMLAGDHLYLQRPGRSHLNNRPSARSLAAAANVLAVCMAGMPEGYVVGVSAVDADATLRAKIAAVCGGTAARGFGTTVSNLPERVRHLLEPIGRATRARNRRVLQRYLLDLTDPVTLIAVRRCPLKTTPKMLTDVCTAFGCDLRVFGWVMPGEEIRVFETRAGDPGPAACVVLEGWRPRVRVETESGADDAGATECMTTEVERPRWSAGNDVRVTLRNVLNHPSVACKDFIVKHLDRLASGRVARHQGVGPWDEPVGDYAAVATKTGPPADGCLAPPGVCFAVGERAVLTRRYPVHGAVTAICEALLSVVLGPTETTSGIVVSVACDHTPASAFKHRLRLVLGACCEFCEELGISFQVSSIRTSDAVTTVPAVTCLTATALSACGDVSRGLTPDLKRSGSVLLLLTCSEELFTCASVFRQVQGAEGSENEDRPHPLYPSRLRALLRLILELKVQGTALSAHDVSDGGVFAAIAEMAIAGRRGVSITVPSDFDPLEFLTSETPGVVIEVSELDTYHACERARQAGVVARVLGRTVGSPDTASDASVLIRLSDETVLADEALSELRNVWSLFSYTRENMAALRTWTPVFDVFETMPPQVILGRPGWIPRSLKRYFHPAVLIFLLPGNPVPEALMQALADVGFLPELVPVAVNTVGVNLDLTLVRGFCVVGQANVEHDEVGCSIMANYWRGRNNFGRDIRALLDRPDVFSLAFGPIGCQAALAFRGMLPEGSDSLRLAENISGQYESRWLSLQIPHDTHAVALQGLRGSLLPCWVQGTHLGFVPALTGDFPERLAREGRVAAQYFGPTLESGPAMEYPRNPNTSNTMAGICSPDGRHLALVFDPCLSLHTWQWPHIPADFIGNPSPWQRIFTGLAAWVAQFD